MARNGDLVCIDTTVAIAYIKGEDGRARQCAHLVSQAQASKKRVVTSALTIAELVYGDQRPLTPEGEARVDQFMMSPWLHVVSVDRHLAKEAQMLARQLLAEGVTVKPADCIHLATAIRTNSSCLYSYDHDHLRLAGRIEGLTIIEPPDDRNIPLPFDTVS